MSGWTVKRFWKEVSVEPTEGGFALRLDGRPVKTPAKAPMVLPTRALAEAAAAEWDAQQEVVNPAAMPVTRSANSAIDTVALHHERVVAEVAGFGETDLLCYRAAHPEALVARQSAGWDPLLAWAEAALGARLTPATGVMYVAQDAAALARLSAHVAALGPFELAAFHDLVSLTGSLILGFATAHEVDTPQALWALSRIDEHWQAEHWGQDEEASDLEALKRQAFFDAAHIFRLARATD